MIENIKKVSNPLTIIAIFACLAELAGTVVLPIVSTSLQSLFIWYVIGFPILLVILFFLTLNFNAKVLYSPSDYSNEDNFMVALEKKARVEKSYSIIDRKLTETKSKVEEIEKSGDNRQIVNDLNSNIDNILKMVKLNQKETNYLFDNNNFNFGYKEGSIYNKALTIIYNQLEINEYSLEKILNVTTLKLKRIMKNLCDKNLIDKIEKDGEIIYKAKF